MVRAAPPPPVVVNPPPTITTQPASASVAVGQSATLSVGASGTTTLSYQWQKNGAAIAGATGATLSFPRATSADAGTYTVAVTNAGGSVTSAAAVVAVAVPNPARLVNLSILTPLAAGDSFTMGFVVGGSGATGTQPLLARAVGPSLAPLGVTDAHGDPQLEFYANAVKADTNNNWGGATRLSTLFSQVGAFPLMSPDSKDAVLYAPTVALGSNSIRVSGTGDASGTVIAELYDSAIAGDYTITTPRLVNVSVLKEITSGLTAGFAIGGTGKRNVLIRAVGPSLAAFGLTGVLADPTIEVFDGASKSIAVNNDWGGDAALSGAFTQVGAFALAGAGSKDSALLLSLSPGSYSVRVGSTGTGTGTALVEIYEVP